MSEILAISDTWTEILSTIATIVGTIIAVTLRQLLTHVKETTKLNNAEKDATEALTTAVSSLNDELVADIKRRASDGKISDIDKIKLRQAAISRAKNIATNEGVDFLNTLTEERLNTLIEMALNKVKN